MNIAGERDFTLEELAKFNGVEEKPAYFAYRRKVYEFTGGNTWEDADHLGAHQGGAYLTEAMTEVPMAKKCLTPFRQLAF